MGSAKNVTVSISTRTIIISILFVLLIALLYYLQDLVLIVLTAVVIASAIDPAVRWFVRRKIPRVFGVFLVYVIVVGSLGLLLYFFLPPVLDDVSALLSLLPQYLGSVELPAKIEESILSQASSVTQTLSFKDSILELQGAFTSISGGLLKTTSIIFGGLFSFVLILILSFYFAVNETGVDDFLRIITPVKHQDYMIGLWRRSQIKIGRWMQGQLLLSLIVAVLLFLLLSILGVQYALLLAILAGILELIPLFGSILAAIPAAGIALTQGGFTFLLVVMSVYLIVNQFQSHLIYPLVVQKVVGLHPIPVILAFIAGSQLAGFLGIILSVPVAAAIQEFVSDIQKEKEREAAR